MKFLRSSGILLHPTSLPGRYGIGDLGQEAYGFIDWLAEAGQKIWQVLPLGPTGYGDSPYQCFSAFAGNPLLIDLERLVENGVLPKSRLDQAPAFPAGETDYGRVLEFKLPLLAQAARDFLAHATPDARSGFDSFCLRHAHWLDDYALFMAVKSTYGGAVWSHWDRATAERRPAAIEEWSRRLAGEIAAHKYAQYVFFEQWGALRERCHQCGIAIMGDIPIYVAHDSSDVWANPELFALSASGDPERVSGVPPDYFSATGQLWGNPCYRWDVIGSRGYEWWIRRFQSTFEMVDLVRLDHFRGFEAFWEVPAGQPTAMNGRWVKGPGAEFFEAVQSKLGELPVVAEDLGVITPEVEALRLRFGFPGMSILQFAFGKDPQGPSFRPHNYPRSRFAYSGTHDNDTTLGWWNSTGGDSVRTAEDIRQEREFAEKYLAIDGGEINWVFIRSLLASVADAAIFPLQDVLGLGSEARMNLPGRPSGNWRWRCESGALTPALARRLRELATLYDR
jgi:4-alpha-glucanotransferase